MIPSFVFLTPFFQYFQIRWMNGGVWVGRLPPLFLFVFLVVRLLAEFLWFGFQLPTNENIFEVD
jgi:hypothetical protein